eukprot:230887-Chlamydomonas_euryale.AAC.2
MGYKQAGCLTVQLHARCSQIPAVPTVDGYTTPHSTADVPFLPLLRCLHRLKPAHAEALARLFAALEAIPKSESGLYAAGVQQLGSFQADLPGCITVVDASTRSAYLTVAWPSLAPPSGPCPGQTARPPPSNGTTCPLVCQQNWPAEARTHQIAHSRVSTVTVAQRRCTAAR